MTDPRETPASVPPTRWAVTTKWKDGQTQVNVHDLLDHALDEIGSRVHDTFIDCMKVTPQ